MDLKPKKTGNPLYAEEYNALLSRSIAGVGPGLVLAQSPIGATLGIAAMFKDAVRARVTAAPTQTDPPLLAGAVVYSVRCVEESFEELVDVEPLRPGVAPEQAIEPSVEGDPCMVLRFPTADGNVETFLLMLTEYPITAVCE